MADLYAQGRMAAVVEEGRRAVAAPEIPLALQVRVLPGVGAARRS